MLEIEWISANQLIEKLNINDLILRELTIKYRLPAYVPSSIGPPINIWRPRDFFYNPLGFARTVDIKTLLFKSEDIEKFEEEHGLASKEAQATTKPLFSLPEGTEWKDIIIALVADNMVRVETPQCKGRFTYHQLGMSDKRTGDKPTVVWEVVKLLCKNRGSIARETPYYDPRLPDWVKRTDKHLQNIFGIKESIKQGHYKTMRGYKMKIKFHDETFS